MKGIFYGDLKFEGSFAFARRGEMELRFTRNERALLTLFAQNPRRLLDRNRILDAINHTGSDSSDRSVDYLVNRLRQKLGDNARDPRFIATQYGEGYIWIAAKPNRTSLSAFLVVGPVFGLVGDDGRARDFLAIFIRRITALGSPNQPIRLVPNWRPDPNLPVATRYSVDANFHSIDGKLHAAFALRDGATRQILKTFRVIGETGEQSEQAQNLATAVHDAATVRLADTHRLL